MTTRAESLEQWFEEPAVTSANWAIIWVLLGILVPTLIRASVSGIVMGCHTIPYVPSVLFAAIFLGWRHAAAVALGSALVSDWLFMGHGHHMLLESGCDFFGIGTFLFASAMIIGSVELPRQLQKDVRGPVEPKVPSGGIVFSLERGEAWASWYGQGSPVRLGPQAEVAEMMEDFLAQLEVGRRLARHNP